MFNANVFATVVLGEARQIVAPGTPAHVALRELQKDIEATMGAMESSTDRRASHKYHDELLRYTSERVTAVLEAAEPEKRPVLKTALDRAEFACQVTARAFL